LLLLTQIKGKKAKYCKKIDTRGLSLLLSKSLNQGGKPLDKLQNLIQKSFQKIFAALKF
jgi:hypothetical protein